MKVVHPDCAGLDVHKRTVVACVLHSQPDGSVTHITRTFSTMAACLQALAAWLSEHGCTHVVMEATGAYWKPVFNILDPHFTLLVVNPEHLRAVSGHKTDVHDAHWLASLLRIGVLRGSFIPDAQQRALRDLTRYRSALVQERARELNRLHKVLEGANIKLASVLTDILGVSGQRILDALVHGEDDPEVLADLAHWRVQTKREALEQAVVGNLTGVLRFVVQQQLRHIRGLDEQIAACDEEVAEQMRPLAQALANLETIPGVGRRTAEIILAEIGADMSRFPTHRHLAAWAGMCPGNRASGGKRKRAGTRHGSPWLRGALTEAGWAAGRCKQGYLAAQYRRLAARRGRKRAVVAVGHSILVVVYHMLKEGREYEELGDTYFDERERERVAQRAVQRLEALGFRVQLEAKAA